MIRMTDQTKRGIIDDLYSPLLGNGLANMRVTGAVKALHMLKLGGQEAEIQSED